MKLLVLLFSSTLFYAQQKNSTINCWGAEFIKDFDIENGDYRKFLDSKHKALCNAMVKAWHLRSDSYTLLTNFKNNYKKENPSVFNAMMAYGLYDLSYIIGLLEKINLEVKLPESIIIIAKKIEGNNIAQVNQSPLIINNQLKLSDVVLQISPDFNRKTITQQTFTLCHELLGHIKQLHLLEIPFLYSCLPLTSSVLFETFFDSESVKALYRFNEWSADTRMFAQQSLLMWVCLQGLKESTNEGDDEHTNPKFTYQFVKKLWRNNKHIKMKSKL